MRRFIVELGAYSVFIVIMISMGLIAFGALLDNYFKEQDGIDMNKQNGGK